jgi:hypothetical protein
MAYRHNDTLHKHKKRETRFRKLAFFTSTIAIILFLVISIDWVLSKLSNSNTVVSRENTTSVQSANVSVYRTEYFQFQAPEEWVLVSSESTDKKFVYVKNNGSLIVSRLVIYVDRPNRDREADFKITNVLPVEKGVLNNFDNIGKVSDHCSESWPKEIIGRNPARITHENVSFVCSPDSQQYNVVIGEADGDEEIELTSTDGETFTLTMVYSDLTAYPNPGDVYNIVSSFNIL